MEQFEIEKLAEEALDAFWHVIVEECTPTDLGNLSPLIATRLEQAAIDAVDEWVNKNVFPQDSDGDDD